MKIGSLKSRLQAIKKLFRLDSHKRTVTSDDGSVIYVYADGSFCGGDYGGFSDGGGHCGGDGGGACH